MLARNVVMMCLQCGVVICLKQGANDLHVIQLTPLSVTQSSLDSVKPD